MSEQTDSLLVVDDDFEIRQLMKKLLLSYGYTVYIAKDGIEMMAVLQKHKIDMVLLDIMLPGEDGFSLCQKIRHHYDIPIIMVTAIGESTDRIVGLEMGADDYLTKPFNPRELVARIKAVTRRTKSNTVSEKADSNTFQFAGWQLDVSKRVLISPDKLEVALSTGEFDLLVVFLNYPQQVMSRDQLLDNTKNRLAGPFDRSIDIQVSRLRSKLEINPKKPQIIKTVRGGGYMFVETVEKVSG